VVVLTPSRSWACRCQAQLKAALAAPLSGRAHRGPEQPETPEQPIRNDREDSPEGPNGG